jgi:putative redox protein
MKINIERINEAVHLSAKNELGNELFMDGSPEIGGQDLAPRPMQVLLMALGGCTSMDVLSILEKMRQKPISYKVEIDGQRGENETPNVFREIHLKYIFEGKLDPQKVKHAIELSMEKYCSVSAMLHHDAKITYSFEIINN